MKLYLTRHTESTYNVNPTCNSNPAVKVPLTKNGLKQAKELAKLLEEADFEFVYTSQLGRTKHTADIINKSHQAPVFIDPRLNDTKTGYEERPLGEYKEALEKSKDKLHTYFNGGESLYHVQVRVNNFLEDLKKSERESVLVVTHGAVIEAIYRIINNLSQEESDDFLIPQGTYQLFEL